MLETLRWLICGAVVVFLSQGWYAYRKELTLQEFFLHGGSLRLGRFVGTLICTNLSLGNMVYVCAIWGFLYAASGIFWVILCIVALTAAFHYYRGRFKSFIEDRSNSGTIHEYISLGYGSAGKRAIRYSASIATVMCLFLALVLESHLAAKVLAGLIGCPIGTAMVALVALITAYTAAGGFRAVVLTDIVQCILLLFGMIAFIWLVWRGAIAGEVDYQLFADVTVAGIFGDAGWWNAISIVVVGFGWLLVTMDTWQRACATRSLDTADKGTLIGGGLLVVIVTFWAVLGLFDAKVIPAVAEAGGWANEFSHGSDPLSDILRAMVGFSGVNGVLGAIFAFGIVVAGVSTTNTFLTVIAHSLISDVVIGARNNKTYADLSPDENASFATLARAVIIALGGLVLVAWWLLTNTSLLTDPLTLFFVAYSLQFSLLAPVFVAMYGYRYTAGTVLASLWVGLVSALICGVVSAMNLGDSSSEFLGLSADKWLALTPVVPVVLGMAVVLLGRRTGKSEGCHVGR